MGVKAPLLPVNPPPYFSPSSDSPSAPSYAEDAATHTLPRAVPPIARCNLLTIRRPYGSVTGSFVIDPELEIPPQMIPALKKDEERKNLLLEVGNKRTIDADVWVVDPAPQSQSQASSSSTAPLPRTTIEAVGGGTSGGHNSLRLSLHSAGSRPFSLVVSQFGTVTLELPRSFSGPLTLHTRNGVGRVQFSQAFESMLTEFSDCDDMRKCFVGDFRESGFGRGGAEWEGSTVEVRALEGKVYIRFVDEPEPQKVQRSCWSWCFRS
ncbi:hypothetical protein EXIGLDRAFT_717217 [Exidia glandulosa HHB12029]|uniref:DUF7330 domain-containing protein n=1 Tax=Exidia glandulosa HHB12029 TaxID=1314781 RepID=A0A165P4I4_EXIGL|nr:hypothetical protein EXIGLDRAFT_717217 [Exidia glandulosa HHB12029]